MKLFSCSTTVAFSFVYVCLILFLVSANCASGCASVCASGGASSSTYTVVLATATVVHVGLVGDLLDALVGMIVCVISAASVATSGASVATTSSF